MQKDASSAPSKVLNQAIRDLRAYILDLRPRQMGSEGLMSGLNRLITEFRANTLATVQIDWDRS